jgi:hypothetical protein
MRSTVDSYRTAELEVPSFNPSPLFIEHRVEQRTSVKGGLASFTSLEAPPSCEGDAILLDVSLHGCQLDSTQHLPANPYQLIIFIPAHPTPILIQNAVTQWTNGGRYGIKFCELSPASTLRLQEAMTHSPLSSWVMNSMRFTRSR